MKTSNRMTGKFLLRAGLLSILFLLLCAWGPAYPPGTPPAGDDALGRVWTVSEDGGWTGTWTRRGDSLVFDAVWSKGGQRVTGVLTMSVQGRTVRIQSRRQTNGNDVDYEGTLAPDGRSIQGTLQVLGWSSSSGWRAVIDGADSGSGGIWRTTEDGGWTGTWTRRGDSQVFDAVWSNDSQQVTGVLTMSVQGRTVRIQSRRQSNGNDVDYEGTLSEDGRSAQGTLRVLGRSGSWNWRAAIETPESVVAVLGRVWSVSEDGGWIGTWTRRGDSLVFDAVWSKGGQRVTGVLTMSVQGHTVRIQSRQQTNGNDVDYEGTLAPDSRSIQGTLRVLGSSSSSGWRASIK